MVATNIPVNELIAALGDQDDEVRRRAQVTLHELGPVVIEPLGEALLHGTPDVRRRVAALLNNVGDARAVAPLVTALNAVKDQCDAQTLVQIVDALGVFGDPRGTKALIAALPDTSPHVQRRIILALVNIGDRRAIPAIEALTGDPTVGKTARWALYQLGD